VVDDVEQRHVAELLPGDEAELKTRFNWLKFDLNLTKSNLTY
jgi:hypothetical protein